MVPNGAVMHITGNAGMVDVTECGLHTTESVSLPQNLQTVFTVTSVRYANLYMNRLVENGG